MPGRDALRHGGAGSGTWYQERFFELECSGYMMRPRPSSPSYEPLRTFSRDPKLVAAVEELVSPPAVLFHDSGTPHTAHRAKKTIRAGLYEGPPASR